MATPGFSIAIHHSLTSPILLGGVPRKFAILNGTFAAALVLGMHSIAVIPLFIGLQIVAMMLAKKDPYFFQIMIRHLRKKNYYRV